MWCRRRDVARALERAVASLGPAPRHAVRLAAGSTRGASSRPWSASAGSRVSWFDRDFARRETRACSFGVASFATRAGARDAGPEKASAPKLKGITVRPNGRVSVRISGGGQKQKTLGTFDSVEEAVAAYDAEAKVRGVPTQGTRARTTASKGSRQRRCLKAARDERGGSSPSGTRSGGATGAPANRKGSDADAFGADRSIDPTAFRPTDASPEALMAMVLDMTEPGRWYPAARAMRRAIHLHVGPTNSGKTHAAVQKLKRAESGVYCSPLRLLAWEVAEGLNADPEGRGLTCNLVTGQERKVVAGSRHVACTVEMADVRRPVDVAVIDEAHLLGDAARGYAFTRAVLGLPAAELHLCGDPAMVPLIEQIARELGEPLTVHTYERLQPLNVLREPLRRVADVRPGDCLVAFSRKAVHQLKRDVETDAGRRACVIYGSLPPEARARQAELFNDRANSGYDVLIASDAIGMGLNLSIKRVVFTTLRKYDGAALRALAPPEARQIAGRAGRFGMGASEGGATTMRRDTLKELRAAIDTPVVPLTKASVAPTLDQIALFLEATDSSASVPEALSAFTRDAVVPEHYFARACDDMIAAARLVEHLPLTLEDRWMFAVAPCSAEDLEGFGSKALVTFAEAFCKRGRVSVRAIERPSALRRAPTTQGELSVLEQAHAAYDLYLWFSLRCPSAFPEHDYAQALRKQCAAAIELGLQRSASAKLRRSGKRLAGYVDETKLARAAAETERLEAELEMAGFGAADDIDGVYGTVTFTPGGSLARARSFERARAKPARASERVKKSAKGKEPKPRSEKAASSCAKKQRERRRGERASRGPPRTVRSRNETASSLTGDEAHAIGTGHGTGHDTESASLRIFASRRAEEADFAARAASARAARGYAADFAAPLLSRRAARETKRRDALLGSIARLAGIRPSYGNEGEDE
jgi:ATP-dependent RNA helicase SUPV3L1/SUV3